MPREACVEEGRVDLNRDAIDILDGQIAKPPPRGLEAFGDQERNCFGLDRLKRLVRRHSRGFMVLSAVMRKLDSSAIGSAAACLLSTRHADASHPMHNTFRTRSQ
jgi:hypothetical protein